MAKAETQSMTRIWDALCTTDPAHTKGFKRAGGFSGTAVKPIWVERRLTELFGPCGIGWGTDEPSFRLVEAGDELLVYCTVAGWYVENGVKATVYGIGGDKVLSKNKYGLNSDDEAFKKAATDAIGNAFKRVGVAADIHMGLFDDNKYVAAAAKEFANDIEDEGPKAKRVPLDGPYKSKSALWKAVREFAHNLRGIGDLGELIGFLETDEVKALLAQCEKDAPGLVRDGIPDVPEFVPLEIEIATRKRELEEVESIANSPAAKMVRAG